jgi:hypothetical protein
LSNGQTEADIKNRGIENWRNHLASHNH